MSDYNKTLQLDPNFSYAYYNRGNFKLKMKEIDAAIFDYNLSINHNSRLAEPYFNRGLVYLYLEDRINGCADIGKAGEMGINKSYNIIKRFCN